MVGHVDCRIMKNFNIIHINIKTNRLIEGICNWALGG